MTKMNVEANENAQVDYSLLLTKIDNLEQENRRLKEYVTQLLAFGGW